MKLKMKFFLNTFCLCLFLSKAYGQQPIASFTTIPGLSGGNVTICEGQTVTYTSTSTLTLPGSTYTWNFGTGANPATATGIGPHIVTYGGASSFTATASLTVSNNNATSPSTTSASVIVTVINSPTLTLLSNGSGFSSSTLNGQLLFKKCGSQTPEQFIFQSNYNNTVTQTFNWGDGTSSTQAAMIGNQITHTFPVGQFTVTHTVSANGCSETNQYIVFNGEAPVISISGSGQNFCLPSPFSIDISSNNVPIDYAVAFSDGTSAQFFNTANDTTVTHLFTTTSCGVDYVYAPGVPPIENAFSVSVVAENYCSTNGLPTVLTLGPITVSEGPTANYNFSPGSPICEGETVNFENISTGGENIGSSGCDSSYGFYWLPVQSSGFTLVGGTYGSSNGFTGANYNYEQWTDGSNELDVTFNTPGTYQFWLYAGNSCGVDSIMQELTINPTGTVIADPVTQTICSGQPTTVVNLTSTVPGYTINWEITNLTNVATINPSQGSGVSPTTFGPITPSNTTDQIGVIEVSATVGCTSVPPTIFTITVNPEAIIEVDPLETLICSGEATDIDLSSNISSATFSWTTSGPAAILGESNGSGSNISQTLTNNGNAMDTMDYVISVGNAQCPGPNVTATVIVQPAITINSNVDFTVCPGEIIDPNDYFSTPSGATITWTNSNTSIGLAGSGNGNIPTWTATNNNPTSISGNITVSAQLNDCPAVQDQFTVTVIPKPEFDYTLNPESGIDCDLNPATINGIVTPNNCAISWVGPGILSGGTTSSPTVNVPGTYSITMTDNQTGCTNTENVNMEPPAAVNITAAIINDVDCFNGSNGSINVQTNNSGSGLTYNWTPSLPNSGNVSGLVSGNYALTITNDDNCQDDTTLFVDQGEPILIQVVDSVGSECEEANGSLTVQASGGNGGFDYGWEGDVQGATLSDIDAGSYTVYVIDANGCTSSQVIDLGCTPLIEIIIPQFLSPNNDALNETWIIQNLEFYPDNKVTVYNRWGNIVYEAEPYNNDWNGHYKGTKAESLPAATYFYVIDTKKKSQDPYTGFIEIQP
jgi:gliding motility-associated-like protein